MRWLSALLLTIGVVVLARAAPFGTSAIAPGGTPPANPLVWQYCFPSTADNEITGCPATATAPSTNALGSSITATYVAKINAGAFNSPSGFTQVIVSLFGASGTATPLSNLCIGPGGGTKAWDFSATPTIICGTEIGGAPGCSSIGANGLVLPATAFTLSGGQPLIVSWDANAANYSRPYSIPKVQTPANVTPAATAITNYNTYSLGNVKQACTATKNTGYNSNFSLGTNVIAVVKKITMQ